MKILNQLWNGDIAPQEKTFSHDEAYRIAAGRLADADERLREALDPAQVELLNREQDAEIELSTIESRDMFLYAFTLGAKLILEIMGVPG